MSRSSSTPLLWGSAGIALLLGGGLWYALGTGAQDVGPGEQRGPTHVETPSEERSGSERTSGTSSTPPSEDEAPSEPGSGERAQESEGAETTESAGSNSVESRENVLETDRTAGSPRGLPAPDAGPPRDVDPPDDADSEGSPQRRALKSAVKQAIEQVEPQLRKCYEDLIGDFPEADGTIGTTFEIDSGKQKVDVAFINAATTLFDKKLHKCFLDNVTELEVDVPWKKHFADTGTLAINYRFQFETPDEPNP